MQIETINYKGYSINIENDDYPQNPFEEWNCCSPLMTTNKDYSNGAILSYLRDFLTYNQVKHNQAKLLDLIGLDSEQFKKDYPLDEYDRTEMLKDELLYNWLDEGMDNLEAFCIAFNIKHYKSTSRGYSQSDWSDCFLCWTTEFGKVSGVTYKALKIKSLESDFETFGHWAWGDVYVYSIDSKDEELIDSCAGFFGDDHEKSGLLEYAQNFIDCDIKQVRKNKLNKLKELIKSKVPLLNRELILSKF